MSGYERLKSIGGGGRYDALASDGRTTYPGVGVSFGVSRTLLPLLADGVLSGSRPVPSAVLVALTDEESRPASERVAAALRARGIACEVAASPQKFGKQIRFAERRGIPYVWFPVPRRATRSRTSAAATRSPPIPTPGARPSRTSVPTSSPRGAAPVIRTHDAGTLSAANVGETVTLAGWVARRRDHGGVAFLDLREASGVVQVVVRDEAVAHSLRSEFCLKVTGEVGKRPEGNANPNIPTGEIEVVAAKDGGVEVLSASDVLPFPDRRAVTRRARSARRRGSSTATSTCAAPVRPRPSGCAARSTRPPATCSTPTTSSRSRRRR